MISFESITIDEIEPRKRSEDEVFLTVDIDLHKLSNRPAALKAKLDMGAQGNILPLRLYCRMYPNGFPKREAFQQSPTVLTAKDGAKMRSEAIFFMTEGPAIIGLPTSLELNLVTLNCSLQKSLAENTNHANNKNLPIKDKDDLVKQ